MFARPIIAASLALAAIAAAGGAQAQRISEYWSPAPVYVNPAPVYVNPPIVAQNRDYRQRSGPWGDWDGDGIPNIADPRSRWYDPRYAAPVYEAPRRGVHAPSNCPTPYNVDPVDASRSCGGQ